jgi:hypothetical protein
MNYGLYWIYNNRNETRPENFSTDVKTPDYNEIGWLI